MSEVEKRVYQLAALRDPVTGEWLYGRRAIKKQIPEISEWQIRKILGEIREPVDEAQMERERAAMDLPQIIINLPKLSLPKPSTTDHIQWVIGSDFHAPHEHEESCELFYQITNYIQPERVILLGDVINLDAFSRYDKIPNHPGNWVEDVMSAGKILGNVRQAAPEADLDWIKGNHEERLKKHLMRHDPLLYDVLDLEKLFVLVNEDDKLKGWTYIDEPEIFEEDYNLILAHGEVVRKHSAYTAKAHLEKLLFSVIVGHSHRLGVHERSSARSRYMGEQPMFAVENGCLCRYDQPYVNGSTSDWQRGFTVLDIDISDDIPLLQPTLVKIVNDRASFQGKTFRA